MFVETLVLDGNKTILYHFRDLIGSDQDTVGFRANHCPGNRTIAVINMSCKFLRVNIDLRKFGRVVNHRLCRRKDRDADEDAKRDKRKQSKAKGKHPRF